MHQAGGVARLSRAWPRRHRSRRAPRHGLDLVAARFRCGAGRSGRVGHLSLSTEISSNAGTAWQRRDRCLLRVARASRCGDIATRCGSRNRTAAPVRARRRHSATGASTRSARLESSTRSTRAPARSCGRERRGRNRHEDPIWGFSSSPLVVGDVVVVAASGKLRRTTSRPASRAGSVRRRLQATARPS